MKQNAVEGFFLRTEVKSTPAAAILRSSCFGYPVPKQEVFPETVRGDNKNTEALLMYVLV